MGTSIEMIERHHGPLLDGSGANMATRLAIFEAATLRIARSADVAQLVERRLPKPKVAGSSPVVRLSKASIVELQAWLGHAGRSAAARLRGVARLGS